MTLFLSKRDFFLMQPCFSYSHVCEEFESMTRKREHFHPNKKRDSDCFFFFVISGLTRFDVHFHTTTWSI